MKRKILKTLGVILLLLIVLSTIFYKKIDLLYKSVYLFDKDHIVHNFLNTTEIIPFHSITKSSTPKHWNKKKNLELINDFKSGDSLFNLNDYLKFTETTGFLIAHGDTIIYEQYSKGLDTSLTHISWSMGKSYLSALFGIAIDEGLIKSVDDSITHYLPQYKNTAYEGVSIKNALQMSSGIHFIEEYKTMFSDFKRFKYSLAIGISIEDFAKTLSRDKTPGTYHQYVSINTQILGMILRKVIKKPLTEYLQEKLWDPMGMEYDAQWLIDAGDSTKMEMALGGLNISLRDYAKFGLLFQNRGNWYGKQLISEKWINESLKCEEPHLKPGANNPNSYCQYGYGYQWWIPEKPMGDFFAAGVYNQYIYVYPEKQLTIVKLSANYHFKEEMDNSKAEHIDMFQAIANAFEK